VAAVAAVGSAGYAFHERHEKKDAKKHGHNWRDTMHDACLPEASLYIYSPPSFDSSLSICVCVVRPWFGLLIVSSAPRNSIWISSVFQTFQYQVQI
jgi:hypothetical protein